MKVLNRNELKIIALIAMIVDHIGLVFFPNIAVFRIIGRVSFPIFAFFISEGYYYTKSRKKYILTLLIFAIISQPFYILMIGNYTLNILFTFLFSILLMILIDYTKSKKSNIVSYYIIYFSIIIGLSILGLIEYGSLGVMLPVIFYTFRNSNLKYIIAIALICFYSIIFSSIQIYSIVSILLLMLYSGNRGKMNIKYLFYVSYPIHMLLIYLISLIV